jgi:1-acyl-sn-glycerol-3-phosphate acyltransferase
MRVLRAASFGILVVLVTGLGFLAASAALLLDPKRGRVTHAVARAWGRAMLSIAGARLTVVGAERLRPDEPRVMVANHTSYLDIPTALVLFEGQLRIVARRTLIWLPFIGWFIHVGGHFAIDRDDPRQAKGLMDRIATRMRRHRLSALVFPEGTRSRSGRLGPMKSGAFYLPVSVGVPVQPFAILGAPEILPKGSWFPHRSGVIEVRVGEPIDAGGLTGSAGRKALADRTRAALLALGVPDGV